jgi:hypothetical protein
MLQAGRFRVLEPKSLNCFQFAKIIQPHYALGFTQLPTEISTKNIAKFSGVQSKAGP